MRALLVPLAACAVCLGQALPMEPPHDSGQSITGAYEGWYKNADGTFSLLVGYYNRSQKSALEIPVGPENKIEPGNPDQGQPTVFLPGRQWGVFTIRVPRDFGDKKLTWTITAHGKTTRIPLSLNLLWEVEPFKDANGNTPPYVSFQESGPFANGPVAESPVLSASVGAPLALPVWVAEDEKQAPGARRQTTPGAALGWSKFRGPGNVTFAAEHPPIEKQPLAAAPAGSRLTGKASTTATFSAPGEYLLRLQVNDWSGEGGRGFQCCWSTAHVKVTVK